MSNSLLGNKQVNRLKETNSESENNVFVGKKFITTNDTFSVSPELFYGLKTFIVVYDFYSNTHVRTIFYKNEVKDEMILGENINEYAATNNRVSYVTLNDYFFKGVRNTIDNREGTLPFNYEEHVFYYNRETGNLDCKVMALGSKEATIIFNALSALQPEPASFGEDGAVSILPFNTLIATYTARPM